MENIKNYTFHELKEFFKKNAMSAFLASQIFDWIYKKGLEDFDLMNNIAINKRDFLKSTFCFSRLKILAQEISRDSTKKFLFGLKDSSAIESVLIPQKERNTLCVSTQVGCKFACKFCLSGELSFKRNLEVCEIVDQYLEVARAIKPAKITNIVFMGIGEPLDNFDNLVKSINILTCSKGLNFGATRISVSTAGLTSSIKDLTALKLGVRLSISLHATDNQNRSKIMPINKKYPLEGLLAAAKDFASTSRKPVIFEYVLIKGLNASLDCARSLSKLLNPINSKLNLILYNPACGKFEALSDKEIEAFTNELKKRKVFYTIRQSRGQDISAACGQLKAKWLKK